MSIHDKSTEVAGPPLDSAAAGQTLPSSIGPFQILDLIAVSQGVVYKARQCPPDRLVALKIPRDGKLLTRAARERFLAEIKVASQLDHSAIVPVLEAGEVDGAPYYTMPFIEGRDLFAEVMAEHLDWGGRLELFQRLCRAVQSLHEHHLVHRDLKPSNILVDRHGDIRLLDFGLAGAVVHAASGERLAAGTPQYMAPEQALGDDRLITPACDVYALGMMLHFLAFDELPYRVDAKPAQALEQVRAQRVTTLPIAKSRAPASVHAVILSALAYDPRLRPRTAGRLMEALNRALREESKVAPAPPTPTERAAVEPSTPGRARTSSARKVAALLVVAGGLLLLAASAAYVVQRRHLAQKTAGGGAPPGGSQTVVIQGANPPMLTPETPPPTEPVAPAPSRTEGWWRIAPGGETQAALRARVQEALNRDFERRNHGALSLMAWTRGRLRFGYGGEALREIDLQAGERIVIFVPADQSYTLDWASSSGPAYHDGRIPARGIHERTLP